MQSEDSAMVQALIGMLLPWALLPLAGCWGGPAALRQDALPSALGETEETQGEEKAPEDTVTQTSYAKFTVDSCVDPNLDEVPTSVTLTLCNGELAQGHLDLTTLQPDLTNLKPEHVKSGVDIAGVVGTAPLESHAPCNVDGMVGCVASENFPAVEKTKVQAAKIKAGMTIAGVTGIMQEEHHGDCLSDGETGCIATGTFRAASIMNAVSGNIKSGVTIAGVNGSLIGETHNDCTADGGVGCVSTSAFKAANMANVNSANIRFGVTIAGVSGAYPSVAAPLNGATGLNDLTSLGAGTPAGSYEFFDSTGMRYTGNVGDAGIIVPGDADRVFADSLYRTFTVKGDADLNPANIRSGRDVFGVVGTLEEAPAACSSNAEVGCVTTPIFKAADLSNLLAENIKAGETIAGMTGGYPSATHPLAGATGATPLPSFAMTAAGASYEWFQADGTRVSGTIESALNVMPGATNQIFDAGLYRSVTVQGDGDLVASNIKNAVDVFGIVGAVVPSAAPCMIDGELNCVTNATFVAAKKEDAIPSNIKDGVQLAGVIGSLSGAPANCASNGEIGCVTTVTYKAANLTNLNAGNVKSGVILAGVTGTYPSLATPLAGANGAVSDLTSMTAATPAGNYEFFDSSGTRYTGAVVDAGNIMPESGSKSFTGGLYRQFTVAGDANLAAANIKAGVSIFGVSGTVSPAPVNCSADNQTGCVTTATYRAANTSAFSGADLKVGKTVAGIAGSLADCSSDGATGCVATTNYRAVNTTLLTPGNIKSGVMIAGVTGDYPSSTNPLTGADVTADLPAFTSTTGGTTYEWFRSDGSRLTGTIQADENLVPGMLNQSANSGLYRSVTVQGDIDLLATNIAYNVSIFGVTGSAFLETHSSCNGNGLTNCVTTATYKSANLSNLSVGNIKAGVSIAGMDGAFPSSTYPLPGAQSGTADLDGSFTAKIRSDATFEYWDSAGTRYTAAGDADLSASNYLASVSIFGVTGGIPACGSDGEASCLAGTRFKAADTQSYTEWDVRKGKTIAGVPGALTFFKNMAHLATRNNTTTPASSSETVADSFDTIDDYNDNEVFPTTAPAGWDTATGAHWIMDPKIDNGAGGGTMGNGLCDGSETCLFIDRITGLTWTRELGYKSWQNSVQGCEDHSGGGYTDWRLPTQKELMQAYTNGIWRLRGNTMLALTSGVYLWSATFSSTSSNDAWGVNVSTGATTKDSRNFSLRYTCVRP